MRSYAERREARIERLRDRAERARREAEAHRARAAAIAAVIPLGQPILVGHHSERRHRRDVERIERGFERAHEARQRAAELERRAAAAERNQAVSSDDPDAVGKLRAKLESIEAERALAVRVNKAVRAKDPRAALAALGLSEPLIAAALEPDPLGRRGIPSYRLTNLGAEARRLRARIAELEARAAAPVGEPQRIGEAVISEEENRVRVVFPSKPAAAVIAELKGAGFRWSPSAGAWQRHASEQAWAHARRIAGLAAVAGA
jgi:hypothetical protein